MRDAIVIAFLVSILATGTRAEGLSRAEGRCLVALSRAGREIAAVGEHAVAGCVRRLARGRFARTLPECVAAASRRRVARIAARATRVTGRACANPPAFGPSSLEAEVGAFAAMLHPEAILGTRPIGTRRD